ncbi:MAG: hypothetical protein ACKVTZ_11930 [Bacteroidia bacterium]
MMTFWGIVFYKNKARGSLSNVMLTKTCSGCFSCRRSAKTPFLQVIGQLKQPVQHYIFTSTKQGIKTVYISRIKDRKSSKV